MRQSLRASKAENTAESSSRAPNQGKVKSTVIPLAKAFTMVVEGYQWLRWLLSQGPWSKSRPHQLSTRGSMQLEICELF